MKTFVVFGANGFIGSNLVDELAKDSKVIAVDRFSKNPSFEKSGNIDIVKTDVLKNENLIDKVKSWKADGVVWTVGGVIPVDDSNNSSVMKQIEPSVNLIKVFLEKKVPVVFVSSAGMLYRPGKSKFTEQSHIDPWTLYGLQKLVLEKTFTLLSEEFSNESFTIFRITSVYGQKQNTQKAQGVVGKLITSALRGEPFVLFGSSKAKRDYVYVQDVAKIIKIALNNKLRYKIYNLSSGTTHTIEELKSLIEFLTQKKIKILNENKRSIDPVSIEVSNSRFTREFSNFEFTKLNKGLGETVDWFRKNL